MRALLAAVALALLAPLAGAEPVERLSVQVLAHPAPYGRVVLYEDTSCATHVLLWEGGWFTVADASRWAAGEEEAGPGYVVQRPVNATVLAATMLAAVSRDAAANSLRWSLHPDEGLAWVAVQAGHEDVCLLSLAQLETGAEG